MADGLPPRVGADGEDPARSNSSPAPQPLTDIRVSGKTGKGLNKPAIVVAAGTGVAAILIMASNGLSSDPSRKPADTKPMMSAPARAEIAQGAVRSLPATYEQVAQQQAARAPAQPPSPPAFQLGPPMAGDVAAFAPSTHEFPAPMADDWSTPPSRPPLQASDTGVTEAATADRSQIFFALRQDPRNRSEATRSANVPSLDQPTPDQLTPLRQPPTAEQQATSPATRALFPGAVISASLVTEINSESPGPVIAQITQAVYDSATGRTLLIPQGARLIGDYRSSTRYGQSRIAVLWSRIIMPNGDEISLEEAALDPSGAAGVTGKVDNKWLDVFGAAALGTLINIGVAATEEPQLSYGGIGIISRDPIDHTIAEGVQRSASIVTNRVVDRSLAIPPSIHVEAGKRISVIVTRRTMLDGV